MISVPGPAAPKTATALKYSKEVIKWNKEEVINICYNIIHLSNNELENYKPYIVVTAAKGIN